MHFWLRIAGLSLVALLPAGCAVVNAGRDALHSTWRVIKPRPHDYRDATQEDDPVWGNVGREGRGNRPLDDEHDPLKPYLLSPKAQAIERSLGVK